MRIRRMRPRDKAGIRAVYRARAAVSVGPMERGPRYWRLRWRDKGRRGLTWVAEERGRLVGYASGHALDSVGNAFEAVWVPSMDGTDLPRRLFERAFADYRRKTPIARRVGLMAGSPSLALVRERMGPLGPPGDVFMAAVIDERALLRDAVRVLRRRGVTGMALRTGKHSAQSSGEPRATVTTSPEVLLGLLLGIRNLPAELGRGGVRVSPRSEDARLLTAKAFPARKFWIQDGW